MNKLDIFAISDVGLVRNENQDAVLVNGIVDRNVIRLTLDCSGIYYSRQGLLCAVADGLGGHQGGSEASLTVLNSLSREGHNIAANADLQNSKKYIGELIQTLHDELLEKGQSDSTLHNLGTTLTGIYLNPNYSIFFHVGDSRLYRFRADYLAQLTRDHSAEILAQQFTDAEFNSLKSGAITNCIGGGLTMSCDPDIDEFTYTSGDTLLICSDGLSDMLTIEQIEAIIASQDDIVSSACSLINQAKSAGGHDNISAILVNLL